MTLPTMTRMMTMVLMKAPILSLPTKVFNSLKKLKEATQMDTVVLKRIPPWEGPRFLIVMKFLRSFQAPFLLPEYLTPTRQPTTVQVTVSWSHLTTSHSVPQNCQIPEANLENLEYFHPLQNIQILATTASPVSAMGAVVYSAGRSRSIYLDI